MSSSSPNPARNPSWKHQPQRRSPSSCPGKTRCATRPLGSASAEDSRCRPRHHNRTHPCQACPPSRSACARSFQPRAPLPAASQQTAASSLVQRSTPRGLTPPSPRSNSAKPCPSANTWRRRSPPRRRQYALPIYPAVAPRNGLPSAAIAIAVISSPIAWSLTSSLLPPSPVPLYSIILVGLTAILATATTSSTFPPGSGPRPPHGPRRLPLANPC
jgi:hypothetical protein